MNSFGFPFHAMGGPCSVHVYAEDHVQAQTYAQAAQAEVFRLEQRYSRYRDDSVTTRINRSAGDPRGIEVDDETAALLDYAQTAWEQSDGLFDITSGVLRQAWDFRTGRVPQQSEIDRLLPLIGWQRLHWQPPRLTLPISDMQLDFGGYVKEYAADRAAGAALNAGARHGFVELAGDIALIGPHPDGSPWQIGIRDPRKPEQAIAHIALAESAIASSGDYERYFEHEGRRYSHLLDPHTGWPVEGLRSVSVVAPQCLVAGTAATIAALKGTQDGPDWLSELSLAHLLVDADNRLSGSVRLSASG